MLVVLLKSWGCWRIERAACGPESIGAVNSGRGAATLPPHRAARGRGGPSFGIRGVCGEEAGEERWLQARLWLWLTAPRGSSFVLMLGTGFNFWVSQSSSRMCRCVGSRSVLGQQRCAGGKAAVRSDTAGRAPTASRAGRRLTPLGRGAPTAGDAAAQERPAPHVGDSQTPRHLFFRVFPKIIPVLFTSTQGPNRSAQVSDRLHLTGRRLRPGQARPGAVFYGLVLPRWRLLCFRHTRSGRAIRH